jgi:protein-disulfide isomerase-like protein with CxxC motif
MTATTQQKEAKTWSNPCVPAQLSDGEPSLTLWHAAAPTCCWSWGFEGTLHRVRLVYGDQVDIRIVPSCVYTDIEDWLVHNELTRETWDAWGKKAERKMGVPFFSQFTKADTPHDAFPATLAVLAAYRQGSHLGERFLRALLLRNVAQGLDVTKPALLDEAAAEAGLDVARFTADLQDEEGLGRDHGAMQEDAPHVPLGFYNLVLDDGKGRTLLLDFPFDPKPVEEAIDFLSGGTLRKNQPDDLRAYLAGTGASHEIEMARAFGWTVPDLQARLKALEKAGSVRRLQLGGHPYWAAA